MMVVRSLAYPLTARANCHHQRAESRNNPLSIESNATCDRILLRHFAQRQTSSTKAARGVSYGEIPAAAHVPATKTNPLPSCFCAGIHLVNASHWSKVLELQLIAK